MYQTFTASSSPEQGPPRLAALRQAMALRGLDAFIVPRADAHQGEYVADCDARLEWLTGFTGSAGFCAVLADVAGVFNDGRYREQVKMQVAAEFTPVDWPEIKLGPWLIERLTKGARVAYDPWLHTIDEIAGLGPQLAAKGISLEPVENLIDPIWTDRPAPPAPPFFAYPDEFAGESAASKRQRLGAALEAAGHSAAVLTLPDSIAWLLNIRGADIERNPVPQSFAILHADGRADLFARDGKTTGLEAHLGADVAVHAAGKLLNALGALTGPVRLDPKSAPQVLKDRLEAAGIKVALDADPCVLPKARKNATEVEGMRQAHLRDGAAVVRFLAWLDAASPKGGLTEVEVVTALEGFRRETNALRDISFDTICGAGPHGAIMHYRVTEGTNRALNAGELVVVDSGGQYLDGTTDITRTVVVGEPKDDMAACYTRVAQGMIAVSRARFPKGVAGAHLDALARFPLWVAGQDFDHGTGHGVGVYLCVHEGPQRISRMSDTPLEPGMILSNEPGYYRVGAFGIRLENLIVVRAADALAGGDAQRKMLDFETLTFVPLDRRLLDLELLSKDERRWIDAYHAECWDKIGPRVEGAARDWLRAACAPL